MRNKKEKTEKRILKRFSYIFIILGILTIIAIGVYALAPNIIPNPGHNISEISIPSGCVAGQFLKYDGTTWVCASICPPGTHIVTTTYTNGLEDIYGSSTSISCSSLPTDTCDGSTDAYTCSVSDSKTCTDIRKFFSSGDLGGWICTKRDVTCKKAAMLCGE